MTQRPTPTAHRKRIAILCILLAGGSGERSLRAAGSEAPPPDRLAPEDIARLRYVTSARISPAGTHVAYTLSVPRRPGAEPSGPARSELHVLLPSGRSRPFVTGDVQVSAVSWTPDGRGIAYLARRRSDAHRALWTIPVDGGESRRALLHETDIRAYSFSPGGDEVAFLATPPVPAAVTTRRERGFDARVYEEDGSPVRLCIARFPADCSGGAEVRVLDLPGSASELHWAPRGRHIAVALAPTPLVDDHYMARKLHVVDADSGKVVTRLETPGKLGAVSWSPDGRWLGILAAGDLHDPSEGRLFVAPASGGTPRRLGADLEAHFDAVAWRDAGTMLYVASEGVTTSVGTADLESGVLRPLVPAGSHALRGLSVAADGRTMAFVLSRPRHPGEVALLASGSEAPVRVTTSNPWLDAKRLARQEVVRWKARDGLELEGILVRPLDEATGRRYPLILSVHGGPEAHVSNGWVTSYGRPGQVAAARGFAVFYPNYRGSTGRGAEFAKRGQADYAGKEFDDLVDAVDHLVSIGLADRDRVGITGGSYGGYATAWASTYHSKRFAAGVMFVGISDLISKAGTTDIPREMELVHARRTLYDHWQWYLERSPIYHVQRARTPLLILHGENDTRVHPSQSLELYRHLRQLGKTPVRLVLYPGEGHGNRRSAARLDYQLRMLRWFEHYLMGPGGEPPDADLDPARLGVPEDS